MTRERRKLKAYKRKLASGELDYPTIENSFRSWLGGHWKIMSRLQIKNINKLYFDLFGKKIKTKKNKRLNWLINHA